LDARAQAQRCRNKIQIAGDNLSGSKNSSRPNETGFPSLSWEDEELPTRPMPLHELPMQARIDHEMSIIAEHHIRIALAIEKFWGHRDCVEYIQQLILNGSVNGQDRAGFKSDVLSALINLVALHKQM
jgi:hypothetical protein